MVNNLGVSFLLLFSIFWPAHETLVHIALVNSQGSEDHVSPHIFTWALAAYVHLEWK